MNIHNKLPETTAADVYSFPAASEPPARRRWLIPLLIALVALAAFGLWKMFAPAKVAAPVAPVAKITVIVPGTSAVTDSVTATGSIAARRDSAIGVQGEGGRVVAVFVEPGQSVARGQVLARIDRSVQVQQSAQLSASVRAADADARLADADLARALKLVDKGFISKADIDRRTATRDGALARAQLARAQLAANEALIGRLDVRAPAAGLVLSRNVETGQVVGAGGTAMFRIAEGGILEMRALVAEQDMARLKPGMPARVTPVGSTTDYPGKIWLLDPVIDAVSRQGVARVAVPYAPGLRVGAFAKVRIDAGETLRPVLPQSAIQADDKGNFVMVVGADNRVARRGIAIGTVGDQGVSVTSGLDGTEKVVVNAGAFLRPGEKVAPVLARTPS